MTAKFIALSKEPANAVTGCLAFCSLIWRTSSINLFISWLSFICYSLTCLFVLASVVFYLNLNTNSPFACFIFFSFTAGEPMISHRVQGDANDGYTYSTSIGAQTVGNTYNWGSQTADTRKEYAIGVTLGPGEYYSLSLTDIHWDLLSPTDTHCQSLSPTVTHWYLLSPTVTHWYLLSPADTHCQSLSSTVTHWYLLINTHCQSLSPTVTHWYLLTPTDQYSLSVFVTDCLSLIPTVTHWYSLSVISTHCHSLSSWVSSRGNFWKYHMLHYFR